MNHKSIQKKWIKTQEALFAKILPTLGKDLIVGEKFLDSYREGSSYFISFSDGKYPLVALLPVEDMSTHGYYSTGEGFVAVHMFKNGEGSNYTNESHFKAHPEYKNYEKEHPVMLYFLGRDDGSYGKQFKTKEDAFFYLKNIGSLDNMVEEHGGEAIYNEFKKRKEPMNKQELEECFKSSLLHIN